MIRYNCSKCYFTTKKFENYKTHLKNHRYNLRNGIFKAHEEHNGKIYEITITDFDVSDFDKETFEKNLHDFLADVYCANHYHGYDNQDIILV